MSLKRFVIAHKYLWQDERLSSWHLRCWAGDNATGLPDRALVEFFNKRGRVTKRAEAEWLYVGWS